VFECVILCKCICWLIIKVNSVISGVQLIAARYERSVVPGSFRNE